MEDVKNPGGGNTSPGGAVTSNASVHRDANVARLEKAKRNVVLFMLVISVSFLVAVFFYQSSFSSTSMTGNAVFDTTGGATGAAVAASVVEIDKADPAWEFGATLLFLSVVLAGMFNFIVSHTSAKVRAEEEPIQVPATQALDAKAADELKMTAAELSLANDFLRQKFDNATRELNSRIDEEERTSRAMLFMLEDLDRNKKEIELAKKNLEHKNEELHAQSDELNDAYKSLLDAEERLSKYNAELEQIVKDRTKEIEEERDKISKLFKQKTEFINQLSHDIRTPLTPINALCSVLLSKIDDDENKQRLEIIKKNAEYLNALVLETLNLAKLDLSQTKMILSDTDLKSLVDEVISLNRLVFNQSNVKPKNKIPSGCVIRCDTLRVKEVMQNLVMNATKFMPSGGKLTFSVQKEQDTITVSVADEGVGMTAEELGRIFEEFYKADPSRHSHSSGLGLAICKKIVEKHGGRMWASSRGKGKGSTFFFNVPKDPSTMKLKTVGQVMRGSVVSIGAEQNIQTAAGIMSRHSIGALLVLEKNAPVGLLTEKDILAGSLSRNFNLLPVKDVMSRQMIRIRPEQKVYEAAPLFYGRKVMYLLVCDGEKIVGILSLNDFIRYLSESIKLKMEFSNKKLPTAGEMSEKVLASVPDSTTLKEAISLMVRKGASYVLVTKKNRLVGEFTERDFTRKVATKKLYSMNTPLMDLVTEDVVTADRRLDAFSLSYLFCLKKVKRIPVVDGGELAGIITLEQFTRKIEEMLAKE